MSEKTKSVGSTKLSKNGEAIMFCFDDGKIYTIPVSSLDELTEDTDQTSKLGDTSESKRKRKSNEIEHKAWEIWKEKEQFLRTVKKMKKRAKKLVENYQKLRFEFKGLGDEAHKIKAEISAINILNQGLPNVPYGLRKFVTQEDLIC